MHAPPSHAARSGTLPGRDLLLLSLLFLVALAIRFWQLGSQPIWGDEGATVDFAIAPAELFWGRLLLVEPNPPGYYLLMRGWVSLFGFSDFAIRVPSAIASSLAIIPMYLLALRHWGRQVAVIATALLVLSGMQVQYAQEARAYALISFFFLAGLYGADALLRRFEARRTGGWPLAALCACCVGLAYAHFTGLFAIAALFVYQAVMLLQSDRPLGQGARFFLRNTLVVLLLVSPVLAIAIYQLSLPSSGVHWIPHRTLGGAWEIYALAWGHSYLGGSRQFAANAVLLGVFLLGLGRAIQLRDSAVLALAATLLFVASAFYLMGHVQPILITRVVIFAIPAVLLVAAFGCSQSGPRTAWGLGLVLVLLAAYNIGLYVRFFAKESWDQMVMAVAARYDEHTAIIHIGGGSQVTFVGGGPVMVLKYWPGPLPAEQYFATDGGSPLDRFIIDAHAGTHLLDPGAPCPTLGRYEHLELLSRREVDTLRQLRASLEASGATMLEARKFDRLINERWSAPDCASAPAGEP